MKTASDSQTLYTHLAIDHSITSCAQASITLNIRDQQHCFTDLNFRRNNQYPINTLLSFAVDPALAAAAAVEAAAAAAAAKEAKANEYAGGANPEENQAPEG